MSWLSSARQVCILKAYKYFKVLAMWRIEVQVPYCVRHLACNGGFKKRAYCTFKEHRQNQRSRVHNNFSDQGLNTIQKALQICDPIPNQSFVTETLHTILFQFYYYNALYSYPQNNFPSKVELRRFFIFGIRNFDFQQVCDTLIAQKTNDTQALYDLGKLVAQYFAQLGQKPCFKFGQKTAFTNVGTKSYYFQVICSVWWRYFV